MIYIATTTINKTTETLRRFDNYKNCKLIIALDKKSKKLNASPVYVSLNSAIMIFGGVPINVFMPPRIEAKAKGIKNFPACHPIFWEVDRVIGSRSAIAPILLMNEERIAAMNIIINKNCVSLGENFPIIFPVTADKPAS